MREAFFQRLLELHLKHPRWGARRLRKTLVVEAWVHAFQSGERKKAPSEATIGVWLREILSKCPICECTDGVHDQDSHEWAETMGLPVPKLLIAARKRQI